MFESTSVHPIPPMRKGVNGPSRKVVAQVEGDRGGVQGAADRRRTVEIPLLSSW